VSNVKIPPKLQAIPRAYRSHVALPDIIQYTKPSQDCKKQVAESSKSMTGFETLPLYATLGFGLCRAGIGRIVMPDVLLAAYLWNP
jgi:hypothetical protein